MHSADLTSSIKQKALALGFDLVGISSAQPHPHFTLFQHWLSHGFSADMHYLANGAEKRNDPKKIMESVKTFICCGLSYYRGHPLSIESKNPDNGWISNYGWGDDYHDVVLSKLKQLEKEILKIAPQATLKSYVDTGAILERSYSYSAGLGWIGKNTCLINTKRGSFFFIGEILTDLELEVDTPDIDHCGKCTRCIDACPTNALKPHELDANKCISYLTIEHRGEIPDHLQKKMGHHLVGCDICQDVCPWNKAVPLSNEAAFDPRPGNFHPLLSDFEQMSQEDFSKQFKNSPIKRVKFEGLKRNSAIARKNSN
jgi:epoxyqueuosine reductase